MTPTTKASVPKLPTAVVSAAPKAGSLVKRTDHTADTAMKMRCVTATDDEDEDGNDDEDEIVSYRPDQCYAVLRMRSLS
jgi:hypothetical protein